MSNEIAELKAEVAKLRSEISRIKVEHAEDRVFYRAINGSVDSLSQMVQALDKQVVVLDKASRTEAKQEEEATKYKEMTLTEIGQLYKKDPAAARKAMNAQGMKTATETGRNPWIYTDTMAQRRIEETDPELAERLKKEAAADKAASYR